MLNWENMQSYLSSKAVIQNRRRDNEFPRQTKTKGVCNHLTIPARNFKGDSLRGEKMKQNKKDRKQQRLESNREQHQKLQLYRQHIGNIFISFSTYSKCQWTKLSNQKTNDNRMDKKTRSIYMLFIRDLFAT